METWSPRIPPSETTALLIPLLLLTITGAGLLGGWLKTRRGWRTGGTRKLFHFTVFTAAAVLSATVGVEGVNLLGGLAGLYVFTVVRIGEGNILYEGIATENDRPRRSLCR